MLGAGGVGVRLSFDAVPVLDEAWEFARQEVIPGGTRRNLASVEAFMDWSERLDNTQRLVLADAQTSGGLLIAVDRSDADALLADLHAKGTAAATQVGTFTDRAGRIEVV
jgi:selenide,water dikinase